MRLLPRKGLPVEGVLRWGAPRGPVRLQESLLALLPRL